MTDVLHPFLYPGVQEATMLEATLPTAALLAPAALTAVLIVSSVAKLADQESTMSVSRQLRLPVPCSTPGFAVGLPAAEAVLGVTLVLPTRSVAQLAAVLSVLLFSAYWLVIARALTFHPRPSCGCLGRIGDQRVTLRTLARSTLLVAITVVALLLAESTRRKTGGGYLPLWESRS